MNSIEEYNNMNKYRRIEAQTIFLEDVINEDAIDYSNPRQQNELSLNGKSTSNLFEISYSYFSKMQLFSNAPRNAVEAYQSTEEVIEKKTKALAKRMVDIKAKIHNTILDFYSGKRNLAKPLFTKFIGTTSDEMEDEIVSMISPEDMKLESSAGLMHSQFKQSKLKNLL